MQNTVRKHITESQSVKKLEIKFFCKFYILAYYTWCKLAHYKKCEQHEKNKPIAYSIHKYISFIKHMFLMQE